MSHQISEEDPLSHFRWSAAVASFGMLLRNSEFKKDASYDLTIKLAKGAKGLDKNGYRAELIRMMENMQAMEDPQLGMQGR